MNNKTFTTFNCVQSLRSYRINLTQIILEFEWIVFGSSRNKWLVLRTVIVVIIDVPLVECHITIFTHKRKWADRERGRSETDGRPIENALVRSLRGVTSC